jgi:hypothetical protein
MGGIADALFGSDNDIETRRTERLLPSQIRLLEKLSTLLGEQLGVGVEPYPGQMYAGESPLQSQLFSYLSGAPETARTLQKTGLQFLTDQTPYDYEAERQYWEQAFVQPTREAFYEETVPQLQEMFAGQGALSSSGFNRALAREAQRMETSLGGQLADVLYRGQQSYLDRQLQQQGLGLSALDRALAEANALIQGGTLQQQLQQAPLTEQYQKWGMSQPYANPWLPLLGPALQVSPYQIDTVVQPASTGLLGAVAPGFGLGFGSALGKRLFPTPIG